MFELIKYGEMLLSTVNEIGDFLLSTPDRIPVYNWLTQAVDYVSNPFGNIAGLLFGSGIVFVLGFRLVKWFTDIVL